MCQETLKVAIELAEVHGYQNITREQIARAANISDGTVTNHLGTMQQMRKKIIRHAARTDNLKIIAQGAIANDDYIMKRVSKKKRIHALQSVA
jgi:AcrR family transcriptional regulator